MANKPFNLMAQLQIKGPTTGQINSVISGIRSALSSGADLTLGVNVAKTESAIKGALANIKAAVTIFPSSPDSAKKIKDYVGRLSVPVKLKPASGSATKIATDLGKVIVKISPTVSAADKAAFAQSLAATPVTVIVKANPAAAKQTITSALSKLSANVQVNVPKDLRSRIQNNLKGIKTDIKVDISSLAYNNLGKFNFRLKETINLLNQVSVAASGASTSLSKMVGPVSGLRHIGIGGGGGGKGGKQTFIGQIGGESQQATGRIEEFGSVSALALRRFMGFSLAAGAFMTVVYGIKSGISEAISFEREMVKVQQVTGRTEQGLASLKDTIGELGAAFGTSSKELMNVTRLLSQAGLTSRDTAIALEAISRSSLAPTFNSMAETTEGVIASMRQFNRSALETNATLGSLNAVAGKFAVESSDLISVIRRTGGAFTAAGGSLEELLALFTSVRATTRESAETIATGFRTIFTRLQRPRTIGFLRDLGIELQDTKGQFIGAFQAVEQLHLAMKNLDPKDVRFARIIEELGGFRQVSKVIPLIQQFDLSSQALQVALAGTNSTIEDSIIAQQSLMVQTQKVGQEFQKLFRDMTASETFRDWANYALTMAKALADVVRQLEAVTPLLSNLAVLIGLTAGGRFMMGFKSNVFPAGTIKKARGGAVPGTGHGDKVKALLEPGEFVIRKDAAEKVGYDKLYDMNRGKKVRMHNGGQVGVRRMNGGGIVSSEILQRKIDELERSFIAQEKAPNKPKKESKTDLHKLISTRKAGEFARLAEARRKAGVPARSITSDIEKAEALVRAKRIEEYRVRASMGLSVFGDEGKPLSANAQAKSMKQSNAVLQQEGFDYQRALNEYNKTGVATDSYGRPLKSREEIELLRSGGTGAVDYSDAALQARGKTAEKFAKRIEMQRLQKARKAAIGGTVADSGKWMQTDRAATAAEEVKLFEQKPEGPLSKRVRAVRQGKGFRGLPASQPGLSGKVVSSNADVPGMYKITNSGIVAPRPTQRRQRAFDLTADFGPLRNPGMSRRYAKGKPKEESFLAPYSSGVLGGKTKASKAELDAVRQSLGASVNSKDIKDAVKEGTVAGNTAGASQQANTKSTEAAFVQAQKRMTPTQQWEEAERRKGLKAFDVAALEKTQVAIAKKARWSQGYLDKLTSKQSTQQIIGSTARPIMSSSATSLGIGPGGHVASTFDAQPPTYPKFTMRSAEYPIVKTQDSLAKAKALQSSGVMMPMDPRVVASQQNMLSQLMKRGQRNLLEARERAKFLRVPTLQDAPLNEYRYQEGRTIKSGERGYIIPAPPQVPQKFAYSSSYKPPKFNNGYPVAPLPISTVSQKGIDTTRLTRKQRMTTDIKGGPPRAFGSMGQFMSVMMMASFAQQYANNLDDSNKAIKESITTLSQWVVGIAAANAAMGMVYNSGMVFAPLIQKGVLGAMKGGGFLPKYGQRIAAGATLSQVGVAKGIKGVAGSSFGQYAGVPAQPLLLTGGLTRGQKFARSIRAAQLAQQRPGLMSAVQRGRLANSGIQPGMSGLLSSTLAWKAAMVSAIAAIAIFSYAMLQSAKTRKEEARKIASDPNNDFRRTWSGDRMTMRDEGAFNKSVGLMYEAQNKRRMGIGAAGGGATGALIGTAILPVIGTTIGAIVGALIGTLGGLIHSWISGTAALEKEMRALNRESRFTKAIETLETDLQRLTSGDIDARSSAELARTGTNLRETLDTLSLERTVAQTDEEKAKAAERRRSIVQQVPALDQLKRSLVESSDSIEDFTSAGGAGAEIIRALAEGQGRSISELTQEIKKEIEERKKSRELSSAAIDAAESFGILVQSIHQFSNQILGITQELEGLARKASTTESLVSGQFTAPAFTGQPGFGNFAKMMEGNLPANIMQNYKLATRQLTGDDDITNRVMQIGTIMQDLPDILRSTAQEGPLNEEGRTIDFFKDKFDEMFAGRAGFTSKVTDDGKRVLTGQGGFVRDVLAKGLDDLLSTQRSGEGTSFGDFTAMARTDPAGLMAKIGADQFNALFARMDGAAQNVLSAVQNMDAVMQARARIELMILDKNLELLKMTGSRERAVFELRNPNPRLQFGLARTQKQKAAQVGASLQGTGVEGAVWNDVEAIGLRLRSVTGSIQKLDEQIKSVSDIEKLPDLSQQMAAQNTEAERLRRALSILADTTEEAAEIRSTLNKLEEQKKSGYDLLDQYMFETREGRQSILKSIAQTVAVTSGQVPFEMLPDKDRAGVGAMLRRYDNVQVPLAGLNASGEFNTGMEGRWELMLKRYAKLIRPGMGKFGVDDLNPLQRSPQEEAQINALNVILERQEKVQQQLVASQESLNAKLITDMSSTFTKFSNDLRDIMNGVVRNFYEGEKSATEAQINIIKKQQSDIGTARGIIESASATMPEFSTLSDAGVVKVASVAYNQKQQIASTLETPNKRQINDLLYSKESQILESMLAGKGDVEDTSKILQEKVHFQSLMPGFADADIQKVVGDIVKTLTQVYTTGATNDTYAYNGTPLLGEFQSGDTRTVSEAAADIIAQHDARRGRMVKNIDEITGAPVIMQEIIDNMSKYIGEKKLTNLQNIGSSMGISVVDTNQEAFIKFLKDTSAGLLPFGEALKEVNGSEGISGLTEKLNTLQAKLKEINGIMDKMGGGGGGVVPPAAAPMSLGGVAASMFKSRGTDTVPAMLTPGEFIVNAESTRKNKNLLQEINSDKSMVYAAGGGFVDYFSKGYSSLWKDVKKQAGKEKQLATSSFWRDAGTDAYRKLPIPESHPMHLDYFDNLSATFDRDDKERQIKIDTFRSSQQDAMEGKSTVYRKQDGNLVDHKMAQAMVHHGTMNKTEYEAYLRDRRKAKQADIRTRKPKIVKQLSPLLQTDASNGVASNGGNMFTPATMLSSLIFGATDNIPTASGRIPDIKIPRPPKSNVDFDTSGLPSRTSGALNSLGFGAFAGSDSPSKEFLYPEDEILGLSHYNEILKRKIDPFGIYGTKGHYASMWAEETSPSPIFDDPFQLNDKPDEMPGQSVSLDPSVKTRSQIMEERRHQTSVLRKQREEEAKRLIRGRAAIRARSRKSRLGYSIPSTQGAIDTPASASIPSAVDTPVVESWAKRRRAQELAEREALKTRRGKSTDKAALPKWAMEKDGVTPRAKGIYQDGKLVTANNVDRPKGIYQNGKLIAPKEKQNLAPGIYENGKRVDISDVRKRPVDRLEQLKTGYDAMVEELGIGQGRLQTPQFKIKPEQEHPGGYYDTEHTIGIADKDEAFWKAREELRRPFMNMARHEASHAIDYQLGTKKEVDGKTVYTPLSEVKNGPYTDWLDRNREILIKQLKTEFPNIKEDKIQSNRELFAEILAGNSPKLKELRSQMFEQNQPLSMRGGKDAVGGEYRAIIRPDGSYQVYDSANNSFNTQGLDTLEKSGFKPHVFHSGGMVPGSGNQHAILQGGEFVLAKPVVQSLAKGGAVQAASTTTTGISIGAGNAPQYELKMSSEAKATLESFSQSLVQGSQLMGVAAKEMGELPAQIQSSVLLMNGGIENMRATFNVFVESSKLLSSNLELFAANFTSSVNESANVLNSSFAVFGGYISEFVASLGVWNQGSIKFNESVVLFNTAATLIQGAAVTMRDALAQEVKISVTHTHEPLTVNVQGGESTTEGGEAFAEMVMKVVGPVIDNMKKRMRDSGPGIA